MALPREKRLTSKEDFHATFRSKQGVKEGKLLLKAKARPTPPANELAGGQATKNASSRFGVVVGKNVAKKAVERNRLRRLLREALQNNLRVVPTPHDIVVVALPGLSLKNLGEANRNITSALSRIFVKHSP